MPGPLPPKQPHLAGGCDRVARFKRRDRPVTSLHWSNSDKPGFVDKIIQFQPTWIWFASQNAVCGQCMSSRRYTRTITKRYAVGEDLILRFAKSQEWAFFRPGGPFEMRCDLDAVRHSAFVASTQI